MAFERNIAQEDASSESDYRLKLHAIGNDLREAQDMAMSMGLDDDYGKVAGSSLARFIQLFERSCTVPLNEKTIPFHAEVRGRMSERLRLTLEIDSANLKVEKLLKKQSRFENLLALISKRKKKHE